MLTSEAREAFVQGDYLRALTNYLQLSERFSEKLFQANIQLCIKKIRFVSDGESLKNTYKLSSTENNTIILNDAVYSIAVPTLSTKALAFLGHVKYLKINDTKHPRALASVKFYDSKGKQISGKHHGLAKSDKYGDFHYLHDSEGREAKLFTLTIPAGTLFVTVEFHPFCLKQGESVQVSNWITCEESGKSALKRSESRPADLGLLGWPLLEKTGQVRMMSVFDEFSRECFSPHANLIEPRPDNAIALLRRDLPELLFIESTWRGNKSTWQYRVAKYGYPPGNELAQLVAECKKSAVPTVFWNKEDPVHFDNFIHAAERFDYIFTTAEEAIPRYQERSSAKVFALPFAAESKLHNPIGSADRNDRVCFAGSYYANRFKERRDDQLMILDAASHFNLDIYDRNSGSVSKDFCFPAQFNSFIRDKLPYTEMNKAYRKYRVFLNVNSVIDSNTMFSRRVFELLACGTPVVSTISTGIDRMFGQDLVWTVRNKAEAKEAIRHLMEDEREWRRRSLQGIRKVFAEHTFAHRFEQVLRITGLRETLLPQRSVLMIGEVFTQHDADRLVEMQNRQSLVRAQTHLLLVTKNSDININNSNVKTLKLPFLLKRKIEEEATNLNVSHVAFLDPKALYGNFYLQDMLNAFDYTNCLIVGKPTDGQDSYEYSKKLAPGGAVVKFEHFSNIDSAAADLIGLENDCVMAAKENDSFCSDAANYLSREENIKQANISMALISINI